MMTVQRPAAMLYHCLEECEAFRVFFQARLQAKPCSENAKWHVILYADEIGHNPVGRDNRKCESIYWSFAEFGAVALHTEACWFKLAVVRTIVVDLLDGHMSALFRLLVEHFFRCSRELQARSSA